MVKAAKDHAYRGSGGHGNPTGRKNGFFVFSNEQRAGIKGKVNGTGRGAVVAKLGEMWKALTPAQQQKYKDQANAQNAQNP
eukprot:NODE_909_length_657_cov_70.656250_g838_i0.p1 GENE.NODE_909_length_657_cov_70.656250_g838_i0~~NODE_909_length_657_cov_70.656250_g838_i0.p1  ORF type:complete len:81 (+),score=23.03 NODE_909_length_657_cov_70.656250_g838_i0:85-327(+)